jgi:tetratricopeptide (TPR) repeat protein
MAKPLVERQMRFRAKRKAQGGIRLDMWLPEEEAAMLKKLSVWRGQKGPQVFLGLINEVWPGEVEKAAARGHADAQFEYAFICILVGEALESKEETARHYSEAQEWFTKSYKQGYRVDACYNNLGVLSTESGDYKRTVEWFQKSAEQGNRVAQYNLGVLTLGIQDYRQAADWFRKSAEQGWKSAQRDLGVLCALGKGITEDYEKALEWLRMWKGGDSTMVCENLLAHWLSTFPKDSYGLRNGQLATIIAERLVRLSRGKSTSTEYLYTLAEAYAEAGRFEEAIKTQKKLLLRLRQRHPFEHRNAALEDCEDRLDSYRNNKPWRDNKLSSEFWLCYDSLDTVGYLRGLRRFLEVFAEEIQIF